MNYHYKFEKVLTIRQKEKDEALTFYQQAVQKFEDAAHKLYELIKKKEIFEEQQFLDLQKGLQIQEIKSNQLFINNLEKIIHHYQTVVSNTRNQMNYYYEILLEKNVEVKKYEKYKERDQLRYEEELKVLENKQMDDVSIQYFSYRRN
ncbi:flagellar export protein FliJ [Bacillus sp. 03113]|uniref:flagellar export protein FliJ n=1 Tax=Bacillus sp. 03113 TaxID=2578211 RepID=UPI001142561F|nr:flagellar export protein FliJ [Bacillus sp. 03113]